MVEFVLVAPILVMLVVIVADFGRVFAASVSIESAARNAAEIGANEYLANPPGALTTPPVSLGQPAPPGNPTYYAALHQRIARAVCAETSDLANSAFDSATGACVGMPSIQICVHDSQDTECATEAHLAAIPAACSNMTAPPSNTHGGSGTPRWVEVRVCYRFTPILAMPLLSFSEFWLQRTRTFTIPCYFVLGSAECG